MNRVQKLAPRRQLDLIGMVAALVGVVGLILLPHGAPFWAFLICFGVAPYPFRAYRLIRDRRRRAS